MSTLTAAPTYSTVDVARVLGGCSLNVVWRWLRDIGHERQAYTWPTSDITRREVLAIYVAYPYERHDLGVSIARAIARTSYPWLFVRVGCILGANTPEALLDVWRQVDTPTGVVLNLPRLASDLDAIL